MAQLEGRLQASMVMWYRNEWYKNPKNLWATFNEGQNVNTKMSLGLMPGVSDLLYWEPLYRGLIGIEIKHEGESHKVEHVIRQAEWILTVPGTGGFCDSLGIFQDIIKGSSNGIPPENVIEYLKALKSNTFVWNRNLFLKNI